MKIALVHNVPTGGAKRSLYDFTRGLLAKGHRVDLYHINNADSGFLPLGNLAGKTVSFAFRPWENPFPRSIGLRSLANYAIGFRNARMIDKVYRRMAERITQEATHEPYDLVYVAGCAVSCVPAVTRHLRIPALCYCQEPPRWGAERSYGWGQRLKNLCLLPIAWAYFRWFSYHAIESLRAASMVLVNSQFVQEQMSRRWGMQTDICYHGIALEKFRPLGIARKDYVLSVGALYPHKGFDFVIRSLGLIPAGIRPGLILLCDRDTDREERHLRGLAACCGVRLEIHKRVGEEELLLRYNEARLFLYASYQEPFGLAPLEAMACATPVVAVGEGGVLETVGPGSAGILTARRETEFAQAVQGLLADDARWQDCSSSALRWVRENWPLRRAQEGFEKFALRAAGIHP